VTVRLLYDWFGCGWSPLFGLFRPLVAAGGEVRVFNPPRLSPALGWTTRDHRKYICTDGTTAFIAGLCMGRMWVGRPPTVIAVQAANGDAIGSSRVSGSAASPVSARNRQRVASR